MSYPSIGSLTGFALNFYQEKLYRSANLFGSPLLLIASSEKTLQGEDRKVDYTWHALLVFYFPLACSCTLGVRLHLYHGTPKR